MQRTIGLCMLAFLAVGTTLGPPVSGQESERDAGRTKRFEAARAQMDEIAKAIQEKAKAYRAAADEAGTMTRSKIDAFHEEIQNLYDKLDKPREEIDKLHEEIQAQYEQAMEQYEQAMDAYTQVSDEYDDAMEAYQDAMDENQDTMEDMDDNEETDDPGTMDTADTEEADSQIEPLPENVDVQPGARLVVLRDAELKVGEKVTGKVRKGEQLVAGQVQEKWVSVRSGTIEGWIARQSVISAALADWYQRLPDNQRVETAGRARAKWDGILLEIAGAGQATSSSTGNSFIDSTYNGVPLRGPFSSAMYENIGIIIRGQGERRELGILFAPGRPFGGPFGGMLDAAQKAKPYGTVTCGDYVTIDTAKRQVFVNGQRRQPE